MREGGGRRRRRGRVSAPRKVTPAVTRVTATRESSPGLRGNHAYRSPPSLRRRIRRYESNSRKPPVGTGTPVSTRASLRTALPRTQRRALRSASAPTAGVSLSCPVKITAHPPMRSPCRHEADPSDSGQRRGAQHRTHDRHAHATIAAIGSPSRAQPGRAHVDGVAHRRTYPPAVCIGHVHQGAVVAARRVRRLHRDPRVLINRYGAVSVAQGLSGVEERDLDRAAAIHPQADRRCCLRLRLRRRTLAQSHLHIRVTVEGAGRGAGVGRAEQGRRLLGRGGGETCQLPSQMFSAARGTR